MSITSDSIANGITEHIVLVFIVAILTPLFTYFGLKRELKLIEQVLAIFVVFLMIEVVIFLLPFIIGSLKSIF